MFLLALQTEPQQQHQKQTKPAIQDNHNLSLSSSSSSAMPPQQHHLDRSTTTDHSASAIIKGKRTKRPRSTSPTKPPPPLTAATSSSSSAPPHDDYCNSSIVSASSPATSSGESTEEEEDMANCLIMLAQGNGKQNDVVSSNGSRKFSEIGTTTNKAGFFVYECKTCNRSFPSFQALGGHRASHKKPKTIAGEEKINKTIVREILHHHGEETEIGSAPTVALQITTTVNNKAKVHECSICGAEFSSGQALGGHMRRHRAAMMAVSAETTVESSNRTHEIKQRNVLSLDLNLPAPEDDHHLHSSPKFQFVASPPSTALVFSTRALIDCHY